VREDDFAGMPGDFGELPGKAGRCGVCHLQTIGLRDVRARQNRLILP
jgi:hypothetical protein